MNPTNLVVAQAFMVSGGGNVPVARVMVCQACGGLFVEGGSPLYYGAPHSHI